jgi:hypothetical protein
MKRHDLKLNLVSTACPAEDATDTTDSATAVNRPATPAVGPQQLPPSQRTRKLPIPIYSRYNSLLSPVKSSLQSVYK